MKKTVYILLAALLTMLCLTGCGDSAPPIDLEGFETAMEAGGYTIEKHEEIAVAGICDNASTAYIPDVSNVDYYVMADAEQANILFGRCKDQVDGFLEEAQFKASSGSSTETKGTFRAKANNMHYIILQRDNVVVYGRALPDQGEAMFQLLEDMGF